MIPSATHTPRAMYSYSRKLPGTIGTIFIAIIIAATAAPQIPIMRERGVTALPAP
jgi:hypothetical protein